MKKLKLIVGETEQNAKASDTAKWRENLWDRLSSFLKIIAVLFPLLAFFIFLTGFMHYVGTHQGYGLPEKLFPITIQETYIWAFTFTLSKLGPFVAAYSKFALGIWGVVVLIGFALVISLLIPKFRNLRASDSSEDINKDAPNDNWMQFLNLFIVTTSLALILVLLLPLLYLASAMIVVSPYQQGKTFAQERLQRFKAEGCVFEDGVSTCTSIFGDGDLVHKGLLLDANERTVAIYIREDDNTYVFDLPSDYSLRREIEPQNQE